MTGKEAHAWHATRLWGELSQRQGEPAAKLRRIIEDSLPEVETVLNKGDTMPGNFTLHDADHSWRVAEWMADLAGEDLLGEVSAQDLAMLLLSAFLHDVGMTPRIGKVNGIQTLLLTGKPEGLDDDEVEKLQRCLDEEWDGIVPPLADGKPTAEELRLVRQITAGYVRSRHNDWSEEWTRAHFEHVKPPYRNWLDHLVLLCRSHHYGLEELLAKKFDPVAVGSPSTVLHLRYCACLLRVADVLDFDPERTPEILFEHREVEDISAIFWRKDRELSFEKVGNRLELTARPPDALTHHAINETVAAVDRELRLCRQLDEQTNFQQRRGSKKPLPHEWTLESAVSATVEPAEDAYVFVDGTFRPDPHRLLDLLGGVALYGSPLAAVRELLQNAFDAVREQIARERLRKPDPASAKIRDALAATHSVTLTLERSGSGWKLTCSDDGVGMSRETITERLLVSGTKVGHRMRQLERDCREHGFSVGRTAQFGIGALSYFLIANRIQFRTRSSNEAGDPDGTGWVFSTLGLTDFGELRRDSDCETGTAVELDVDLDAWDGDPEDFAEELAGYVTELVRRTPCEFSFSAPEFDLEFSCEGWPSREDDARSDLVEDRFDPEVVLFDIHEGDLPNGLGAYRIHLARTETAAGPSLARVEIEADPRVPDRFELGLDNSAQMGMVVRESWNGMEIGSNAFDVQRRTLLNSFVEIDWTSEVAGQLRVDRNGFGASAAAEDAAAFILDQGERLLEDFVWESSDSPLALLNLRQLDELRSWENRESRRKLRPKKPYWQHDEGDDFGAVWYFSPLVPPVLGHRPRGSGRPFWRGKPAIVPAHIELEAPDGTSGGDLNWYGSSKPQLIGSAGDPERFEPVAVWQKLDFQRPDGRPQSSSASFPPAWKALAGVNILTQWNPTVWNRDHPLLRAIDSDAWEWARTNFLSSKTFTELTRQERLEATDPRHELEELLESDRRIAAWIVLCLEAGQGEAWNRLAKEAPAVLADAWSQVPGLEEEEAIFFYGDATLSRAAFHMVTKTSWTTFADELAREVALERLPDPGEKWKVSFGPRAAEPG